MPGTVLINSLPLVHQGSLSTAIASIPDMCKTPSPAGPVPIPYPNVAQSVTLVNGTLRTLAEGGFPIAVMGSMFATSSGDEPGVAGGVKSGIIKGPARWVSYSFNVLLEGKNACRVGDMMELNLGNTLCLGVL